MRWVSAVQLSCDAFASKRLFLGVSRTHFLSLDLTHVRNPLGAATSNHLRGAIRRRALMSGLEVSRRLARRADAPMWRWRMPGTIRHSLSGSPHRPRDCTVEPLSAVD